MNWDHTFSPQWAPHVVGRYTARKPGEEQRYEIECTKCNSKHGPTTCQSGLVRQHIANFALVHVHRDPLLDPFPKEPPKH